SSARSRSCSLVMTPPEYLLVHPLQHLDELGKLVETNRRAPAAGSVEVQHLPLARTVPAYFGLIHQLDPDAVRAVLVGDLGGLDLVARYDLSLAEYVIACHAAPTPHWTRTVNRPTTAR